MKVFIIDNYDSFTYNLVHYLESFDIEVLVRRNDVIDMNEIKEYDRIILSPGPGIPKDAGLMMQVLKEFATTKPILGICLGHQAIGEFFGAKLSNAKEIFHGVSSLIEVDNTQAIFKDLPNEFLVGRYHSWFLTQLPANFEEIAKTKDKVIMGMKHTKHAIIGLQFHPESIMTTHGKKIIENWLNS